MSPIFVYIYCTVRRYSYHCQSAAVQHCLQMFSSFIVVRLLQRMYDFRFPWWLFPLTVQCTPNPLLGRWLVRCVNQQNLFSIDWFNICFLRYIKTRSFGSIPTYMCISYPPHVFTAKNNFFAGCYLLTADLVYFCNECARAFFLPVLIWLFSFFLFIWSSNVILVVCVFVGVRICWSFSIRLSIFLSPALRCIVAIAYSRSVYIGYCYFTLLACAALACVATECLRGIGLRGPRLSCGERPHVTVSDKPSTLCSLPLLLGRQWFCSVEYLGPDLVTVNSAPFTDVLFQFRWQTSV